MRSNAVIAAALLALAACGSTTRPTEVNQTQGFVISGNPESASGATWTFRDTLDGVAYDLTGSLLKPPGPGPFPAVLISHGSDGSADLLMRLVGSTMVNWGLVCIAVNYTHSTGVPIGAPGDASEPGASQPNILRAHATRVLLVRLGYVDTTRIALHGHSMGAWVNSALAAAYPNDFRVASTTGGGVRPDFIVSGPAPSPDQGRGIRIPFQLHHGDQDATVPLSYDQRFDSLLTAAGVDHQFFVYPGEDHLAVRTDATMFARVHAWYTAHGMF